MVVGKVWCAKIMKISALYDAVKVDSMDVNRLNFSVLRKIETEKQLFTAVFDAKNPNIGYKLKFEYRFRNIEHRRSFDNQSIGATLDVRQQINNIGHAVGKSKHSLVVGITTSRIDENGAKKFGTISYKIHRIDIDDSNVRRKKKKIEFSDFGNFSVDFQ